MDGFIWSKEDKQEKISFGRFQAETAEGTSCSYGIAGASLIVVAFAKNWEKHMAGLEGPRKS